MQEEAWPCCSNTECPDVSLNYVGCYYEDMDESCYCRWKPGEDGPECNA